ncbi:hypothetical protein RSAG8_08333, partial [Rhizoctonia solani AG-8 WAC10335]
MTKRWLVSLRCYPHDANLTLSAGAQFPNVSTSPAGTIVHISVRPFGPPADEDIVKAKKRLSFLGPREPATDNSHGRSTVCGCVIS